MPSYEQNKSSKLWSVRFREPDEYGIPHQKRLSGFKTKKAAQYGYEDYCKAKSEEAEALAKAKADQEIKDPNDLLFDTLLESYYKYQESRIKTSSLYEIKRKVDKRILPYFKGKSLNEIKPIDVLAWQNDMSAQFSFNYTSDLMTMLTAIYRYGEKYHDIKNIMVKVDKPRNTEPKKEMLFWTPEEFAAFRVHAEDPTYKMFFTMLYISGCRRGEAEALTWNDIDLKKSTLKISKSITRKSPSAPWEITTPKNTSSNRTVTLPKSLCEMLSEYKKQQSNEHPSPAFVFGGERPLAQRTTDRYFADVCEKAGVKKIRLHDLRHSCASLLISKGVSIVAVSRQLGHSNIEQTLNTYSHLMPDDKSKITAELEAVSASFV